MLVLTRKTGEVIQAGEIKITVISIKGDRIRIGIEAPREVQVSRPDMKKQNKRSEVPDMSNLTEM